MPGSWPVSTSVRTSRTPTRRTFAASREVRTEGSCAKSVEATLAASFDRAGRRFGWRAAMCFMTRFSRSPSLALPPASKSVPAGSRGRARSRRPAACGRSASVRRQLRGRHRVRGLPPPVPMASRTARIRRRTNAGAAAKASANPRPVVLVLIVISTPLSKTVWLNEQPPGGVAPDCDDTPNQRADIRRHRHDSNLSA